MIVDYIRQIYASQKFNLIDEGAEFVEFHDMTEPEVMQEDLSPELELLVAVKIKYQGEIPDSYKALNLMIGDYVNKNVKELTKLIHNPLKKYLKDKYPIDDAEELDEETTIWLDQLDYMPHLNEDEKTLTIEIELVIEAEEC